MNIRLLFKSTMPKVILALVGAVLLQGTAYSVGERGTVPDSAGYDTNHPIMDALARAGVVGGIPVVTHVKADVWPGGDIQAAIDNGGPGVVFLHNGTYELWNPIAMKSGVILRGESRTGVILSFKFRSTWKQFAIQFWNDDSYAGLENLTASYDAVNTEVYVEL